jgi:hypothetical protein
MTLQLLFPSSSLRHSMVDEDAPLPATPRRTPTSPQARHATSRAEWVIASAIVVVALVLALLFIGPPHVL